MPPRGRAYSSRSRWNFLVAFSVRLVSPLLGLPLLGPALLGPALLEAALLEAALLEAALLALCRAAVRRAPSSVGSGSGNGGTWIACEVGSGSGNGGTWIVSVDLWASMTSFRVTRCFNFLRGFQPLKKKTPPFLHFFFFFRFFFSNSISLEHD